MTLHPSFYTAVATALRTQFSGIKTSSTTIYNPSEFPFVCFEEADNFTYTPGIDSGKTENFAEVMYEVNVYSNKAAGPMTECRSILSAIDSMLEDYGFVRTSVTQMPVEKPMTARLVARYSAVVSTQKIIYWR